MSDTVLMGQVADRLQPKTQTLKSHLTWLYQSGCSMQAPKFGFDIGDGLYSALIMSLKC